MFEVIRAKVTLYDWSEVDVQDAWVATVAGTF